MGSWVRAPAGSQSTKSADPQKQKTPEVKQLENQDTGVSMTKKFVYCKNTVKNSIPNIFIEFEKEKLNRFGQKQVVLILIIAGQRLRFLTGVVIYPEDWNEDKNLVRKTNDKAAEYNTIIKNDIARLTDILVKYRLAGVKLSRERLKEDFEKPEFVFDFIDFMDKAINERKGLIADSTIRQHLGILSKLKEYQARILSDELTEEFFDNYSKYLKIKKKNDMNTRHGNFKTIRSYIQIAIRKELLNKNPMEKNPVKQIKSKRTFLDDGELKTLIDLYRAGTLSNSLQAVLRWFLFCCLTGLRISDLRRIKMDDIAGDLLILTPYKTKNVTGKTIKIPLKEMAKQLIQDEGDNHIDGLVFNCIAEQNMREYIKLIVNRECEIKKEISWHAARHTFATVFLRHTNNLAALQKLLGHANISETMIYAHVMTEDVQDAMNFQNNY